ncbi:MAG TPA: Glu-tRNA(Gln) amidotransferase subunit GatE, partial [Methanomicrobia archaeon]|nr:Glu-tRNA(Gln) amidotransferase subunit GatE [Methanomicrobia archaeon]
MDYAAIGLRVGLEIHAQLDTGKLFCRCPSVLSDSQNFGFKRQLRPTMSELGEIDPAAKEEFTKGMMNLYKASTDGNCLVYSDEEPPHDADGDAIETLLKISLMLNADIVDVIHFMRKIVIDGSNVSGFQRTAMIALNGEAYSQFGNVLIPTICLEEDAARLIEMAGKTKIWNIDRLGTPLVEIATDPSMHHPQQTRDIALYLGQVMKATGRLKRGIGTIRQDVNISIERGARVEIKGVQELNMISDYVHNECLRQLALLDIANKLEERGVRSCDPPIKDLSLLFEDTACKIIKGNVFGILLEGFSGLIGMGVQPGRRFGTELADYAKKYVRGIFHSDELPAYGISAEEVKAVRASLGGGDDDAFVLVAAEQPTASLALQEVIRRSRLAIGGVPHETRRPMPDGTSQYMRPLPGKSRMYPETDVYPIVVEDGMLERLRSTLPELPAERIERLCEKYGIAEDNARKILEWDVEEAFIDSQERRGMSPGQFLRLMETLTMLKKEGFTPPSDEDALIASFMGAHEDIPLESYEAVLRHMLSSSVDAQEAARALGIERASSDE